MFYKKSNSLYKEDKKENMTNYKIIIYNNYIQENNFFEALSLLCIGIKLKVESELL